MLKYDFSICVKSELNCERHIRRSITIMCHMEELSMNKYILLIIFFIMVLGFTSCSSNSLLESELAQTSSEQEFVIVTSEEAKNTGIFSNEITTEVIESLNVSEDDEMINSVSYYKVANVSDTVISQEITGSETISEDTEVRFNPFFGDINEYSGKEVSFVCFYFIKCYPLSYREAGKDFSVLYVFSDGTCNAEIFTNKDYFTPFTNNDIFSFDEINEPILVLSEELETLNSDTTKKINFLIQQINFKNEYIDHYPDSRNPNIEHPAVDPEYDIVDFYAADKDGNLHRILYDYVFPDRFDESGFRSTQIELEDENAKQAAEILINLDVVKYWLENYALKIGE